MALVTSVGRGRGREQARGQGQGGDRDASLRLNGRLSVLCHTASCAHTNRQTDNAKIYSSLQ